MPASHVLLAAPDRGTALWSVESLGQSVPTASPTVVARFQHWGRLWPLPSWIADGLEPNDEPA